MIFTNGKLITKIKQDPHRYIRLNLGCGEKLLPDFINSDMAKIKDVVPFDARIKFSKGIHNTVDYIYCSHLFEHLESWIAREFLIECYHIMKSDGILRIVVPNLDQIIKRYLDNDYTFFNNPLVAGHSQEELDVFRSSGYLQFEDLFLGSFYSSMFVRKNHWGEPHRYMYNFPLLKTRLFQAGFNEITETEAGNSGIESINTLELSRGQDFIDYSLFVEALK